MQFTEFDFLITISTFIILIVVAMMILIYGVFIKKKSEMLLAQQRKESVFEQELAISQVEIKEQTLNYIGQELHDDLGQKLSVAKIMSNRILLSKEDDIQEIGKEINQLLGECIQDIRNLSKIFISKQVENFIFIEAVEREVFRLRKLQLIEVDFVVNNRNIEINNEHALILYRIIQESINNVIKHSRAKNIFLSVFDDQKKLTIRIADDGIGFDKKSVNDGNGLSSMENRAKIINAQFRINSIANNGSKVIVVYKK